MTEIAELPVVDKAPRNGAEAKVEAPKRVSKGAAKRAARTNGETWQERYFLTVSEAVIGVLFTIHDRDGNTPTKQSEQVIIHKTLGDGGLECWLEVREQVEKKRDEISAKHDGARVGIHTCKFTGIMALEDADGNALHKDQMEDEITRTLGDKGVPAWTAMHGKFVDKCESFYSSLCEKGIIVD